MRLQFNYNKKRIVQEIDLNKVDVIAENGIWAENIEVNNTVFLVTGKLDANDKPLAEIENIDAMPYDSYDIIMIDDRSIKVAIC